jgi:hypothetical protein
MKKIREIWKQAKLLQSSFGEHKQCMHCIYSKIDSLLQSPDGTLPEFYVSMDKIPKSFFALRKNLFSTLFMSSYHMLDIPKERRLLYGKLNHLFRAWVTSADNLLDDE